LEQKEDPADAGFFLSPECPVLADLSQSDLGYERLLSRTYVLKPILHSNGMDSSSLYGI
jgi:hypothetical protein